MERLERLPTDWTRALAVAAHPDDLEYGSAGAVGGAGNRWIFPELGADSSPWSGVRYVAVSGSPQATHGVDITDTMERAVASLEAHRAYLDGLGEHPMASAREFLEFLADMAAPAFGDRRAAAFELIRT